MSDMMRTIKIKSIITHEYHEYEIRLAIVQPHVILRQSHVYPVQIDQFELIASFDNQRILMVDVIIHDNIFDLIVNGRLSNQWKLLMFPQPVSGYVGFICYAEDII